MRNDLKNRRLSESPCCVQVTYTFFVLISIFSLVLGYYDIIKNVPLFRKVMPVDFTTPIFGKIVITPMLRPPWEA